MNKLKTLQIDKALKLLRTSHDFNQKELAAKLEISKSYLSEIESAKKRPSIKLIENYAQVFQIPVSSIFFLAENINVNDSTEINSFVSPKIIALIKFLAKRSIKHPCE
ncbi:MAG: helix-turn-helix transcriptional regulator [Cyanobacteria bacterium P01_D01_bin.116]